MFIVYEPDVNNNMPPPADTKKNSQKDLECLISIKLYPLLEYLVSRKQQKERVNLYIHIIYVYTYIFIYMIFTFALYSEVVKYALTKYK